MVRCCASSTTSRVFFPSSLPLPAIRLTPGFVQGCCDGFAVSRNNAFFACEQGREIELGQCEILGEQLQPGLSFQFGQGGRGSQKKLGRDAAAVQAGAAKVSFFNNKGRLSKGGGLQSSCVPCGAAAPE